MHIVNWLKGEIQNRMRYFKPQKYRQGLMRPQLKKSDLQNPGWGVVPLKHLVLGAILVLM
jgi:hypothetical protein